MDWSVKIIIVISILVQFAAAVLAFRLIFVTRRIFAWTFIAVANFLMAVRRCLTFYGGLLDPAISTVDLASAVTTLGISASMLAGVALIRPLFLAIDRDKQQLAQSREEFQLLAENYFKRINDTYGHEAGDTLLAAVGGYIKKHIRREDVPCRYGGEEFLLILPDASLENTYNRAEELRKLISKVDVKHLGLSLGKITASFGVAACPDHGENMEDVIRAADAALYLAKSGGRNLTVMASQALLSPGLPDADLTFSN